MKIKILGSGCPKCQKLEANTKQALKNLGIVADVDHVKDIVKIMDYNILKTPGLVVDGKVIASGKVLDIENIEKLIKSNI